VEIRPSRRTNLRGVDLDGNEIEFVFTISKKLYRCPGCGLSIDVGREHTLVRYLEGPKGSFHQHWHSDCAADSFRREMRNVRSVAR
jgi:hypothetical protein